MKAICILLFAVAVVFLASGALLAQVTFEKWFGGGDEDYGNSVWQTADGGYIIGGYTRSYAPADVYVYLIKTDESGDTLWTRIYGDTLENYGYSVQQTTDNGYIIAGCKQSTAGDFDVYLIKTDSLGDTLWTKTYGSAYNDESYCVQQTTDGGYIIAAYTILYAAGDFWLIKTDVSGNITWTNHYGGSDSEYARYVQQTSDGGYIIAGITYSYGGGNQDFYLVKTNASGDTSWTKTFGGASSEICNCVQQTTDGGYILTGYTNSYGAGSDDVWLIKTDASGNTIWANTFGGTFDDHGQSVQQTTDGGYMVTGMTYSYGVGEDDVWIIKTDPLGDTLWTKTYGAASYEVGESVHQTTDGGYIVGGVTYSYGSGDVYLIKTDSLGNVGILEEPYPKPENRDIALTVFPNPFSTVAGLEVLGTRKGQELQLDIYDAGGRLAKSIKLTTRTFELGTDLKAGIYFLKADGKYVAKVVKVR
jgi:hypothetical protein